MSNEFVLDKDKVQIMREAFLAGWEMGEHFSEDIPTTPERDFQTWLGFLVEDELGIGEP